MMISFSSISFAECSDFRGRGALVLVKKEQLSCDVTKGTDASSRLVSTPSVASVGSSL